MPQCDAYAYCHRNCDSHSNSNTYSNDDSHCHSNSNSNNDSHPHAMREMYANA
jgi:hypothetical protein